KEVEERVAAAGRELRGDLGEFDRIAEEVAAERLTAGPVVPTPPIGILEEDASDGAVGGDDLRPEHGPRFGMLLPGLPGALVNQAEFVTRPEIAVEIELPAKDVRQLRYDAGRGSGVDRVLAQAVLDPSRGPPDLGEVREAGARRL